ncbi:glycosyltransferase [Methylosinus sp. H3A]|uniref:glycosyltransferase n=1 Tax=Methylosinus sp. H3A TaxID=2785786 RepID=UPI001FEF87EA|nr:nucleotide disphospho-sugar-binding domain-containing protein [Methylosinus sp. H3A]
MAFQNEKSRLLVLGWEGGGNVPPTIATIRALAARGHDVRFIGDDCILPQARAAGARALPWTRAPNRRDLTPQSSFVRDWEQPNDTSAFFAWAQGVFLAPALRYAEDVVEAAQAEPTDAIIGSDVLFGGMVAAEALGLPHALLAANLSLVPLPGHPPFGPGFFPAGNDDERHRDREVMASVERMFDGFLPQINAARAKFQLPPLSRTLDQFRSDLLLLCTAKAFDFPVDYLPAHVRYVGPLLEQPAWALEGAAPQSDERPTVLVSFSTTYQRQEAALAATIEALGSLPVRGVVTLGVALAGLAPAAPPNVEILDGASHDEIIARAACVVTHGGHGTTLRALRAGAPILVLPMGRDQNDNAARVEYHGAGLRLSRDASAAEIAAAIRRLLDEPSFAGNAQRLALAIAGEGGGAERVVDEVEAMIRAAREPRRSAVGA